MSKKRSSQSHDAALADAPLPGSQGSGTNTKHRPDAEGRVQGIAAIPPGSWAKSRWPPVPSCGDVGKERILLHRPLMSRRQVL